MSRYIKGTARLARYFDVTARVGVATIAGLVVVNIVLRLFHYSINQSYDLVCLLMLIVTGFSIAYCALQKGHVAVGALFDRLSKRIRTIIETIVSIVFLLFFGSVIWGSLEYGMSNSRGGEIVPTLGIPVYPFIYLTGLSFLSLWLVLFVDFLKLEKVLKKRNTGTTTGGPNSRQVAVTQGKESEEA